MTSTEIKNSKYKSIFTYSQSSTTVNVGNITSEVHDGLIAKIFIKCTTFFCYITFVVLLPWSLWFCLKRVQQYERFVSFRMGRLQEIKGPGLTILFPIIDKFQRVDIRTKAFMIPPQQILSSDGAVVEVGAEIQFRVSDVVRSVMFVKKLDQSARTLGRVVLGNKLREHDLYDLQNKTQQLNARLQDELNRTTLLWGLEISRVNLSTKVLSTVDEKHSVDALLPCLKAMFGTLQKTHVPRVSTQVKHNSTQVSAFPENVDNIYQVLSTALQHVLETPPPGDSRASCELQITGEIERNFWFIEGGRLNAGRPSEPCDVRVETSFENLKSLLDGSLSPLQAYISGNIQVNGDKLVLMKILNKHVNK